MKLSSVVPPDLQMDLVDVQFIYHPTYLHNKACGVTIC